MHTDSLVLDLWIDRETPMTGRETGPQQPPLDIAYDRAEPDLDIGDPVRAVSLVKD